MSIFYHIAIFPSLPLPFDPFPSLSVSFRKGRRIKGSDGGGGEKNQKSRKNIHPRRYELDPSCRGRGLTLLIVNGFPKFEILLKATVQQILIDGRAVRDIVQFFNDATSKLALTPENLLDILVTYLKFTKKFAHRVFNISNAFSSQTALYILIETEQKVCI